VTPSIEEKRTMKRRHLLAALPLLATGVFGARIAKGAAP